MPQSWQLCFTSSMTFELKQARLLLAEAARQGIENALRILKITCPEKM